MLDRSLTARIQGLMRWLEPFQWAIEQQYQELKTDLGLEHFEGRSFPCWHQLALSPPDLLLTDVRLGAFNRLQLVISAKAQRPETIAIVISAFDDSTPRKEAEQAGALYVLKPFTSERLLTPLARAPSRAAEV